MATARGKTDWEAVERDYRTGKFTLRELGDRYGISHQAVAKKVKNLGWTQDLTKAIRQATQAVLISEIVNKKVDKSCQTVAKNVRVAAEVNKQIILGHRQRVAELTRTVAGARHQVVALGAKLSDIREAGVLAQAVNSLVSSTKTLIDLERKAFGLDESLDKDADKSAVATLTDAERVVKLNYLMDQLEARK